MLVERYSKRHECEAEDEQGERRAEVADPGVDVVRDRGVEPGDPEQAPGSAPQRRRGRKDYGPNDEHHDPTPARVAEHEIRETDRKRREPDDVPPERRVPGTAVVGAQ